jgi:hypothetical protein
MDIDKSLVSLRAFIPDDQEVVQIIQLCSLYPTNSWRHWTDYLGHNLVITENKKVVVFKEHPLAPVEKIITDIYHKSYPQQLAQISKRVVIAFGEEDKFGDVCLIWFLGKDNKLRMSLFSKGQWIDNPPPLSSGVKTLRFIVKHLGVEQPESLDSKYVQSSFLACKITKIWGSNLPMDKNIKLDMLLQNSILASKILPILV